LHHVAPPSLLNVVAQFYAEWAVVVKTIIATVNFGGGKDEAAALTEADDFFHETITGCICCHKPPKDGVLNYWVKVGKS